MTESRSRQRRRQIQEPKKEGENMTTETEDETTATEEVQIDTTFPKTVGDRVFQTPAELEEFAASLTNQLKEIKPIVKATKPGRPTSQKKVVSSAIADFINENMDDELKETIEKVEGDFILRLNLQYGVFSLPTAKTRAEGSGGSRGGRKLIVDGKEYPSAKNARDTLYPDMKEKSQNYGSIVAYLKNELHEVVTDEG